MPHKDLNHITEEQLLDSLKDNNEIAFSSLFKTYYKDLVLFSGTFIKDKAVCEDIVQNIFLNLWVERFDLDIKTSLKSYLLQSVKNKCFDELRHKKVVDSYIMSYMHNIDPENYILYSDLQKHLQEAIDKLPPKYRESFILSRYKNLKYKEISEQLNVSVRTVEERISKALMLLRVSLKEYFTIIFYFIYSLWTK